jgi:hypothetical protein
MGDGKYPAFQSEVEVEDGRWRMDSEEDLFMPAGLR